MHVELQYQILCSVGFAFSISASSSGFFCVYKHHDHCFGTQICIAVILQYIAAKKAVYYIGPILEECLS